VVKTKYTASRYKRKRISSVDIVISVILTTACVSMLYPFLNLFFISISDISKVSAAGGLLLYPQAITLDAYRYVYRYNNIWISFQNTVFITLVGTALSLVLTVSGGYSLSYKGLPGRNLMTVFVLVTMFFNGGLIPTYLVVKNLNMLNTRWALILPGAVSTWNLLLARNFFVGIPSEISQSARIDGASELHILRSIIIPLSMPIIATLTLFYGLGYWNTYRSAVIYNTDTALHTLQVVIRRMYTVKVDELELDSILKRPPTETIRAATVVFATVPIIAIYPYLQKYFVKGIMVGALKG